MKRKRFKFLVFIANRGLTQTEISRKSGISEARLSRIVNGHKNPSDDEVNNLANVLNASELEVLKQLIEEQL